MLTMLDFRKSRKGGKDTFPVEFKGVVEYTEFLRKNLELEMSQQNELVQQGTLQSCMVDVDHDRKGSWVATVVVPEENNEVRIRAGTGVNIVFNNGIHYTGYVSDDPPHVGVDGKFMVKIVNPPSKIKRLVREKAKVLHLWNTVMRQRMRKALDCIAIEKTQLSPHIVNALYKKQEESSPVFAAPSENIESI